MVRRYPLFSQPYIVKGQSERSVLIDCSLNVAVGRSIRPMCFSNNVGSGPPGLHLATLALRDPRGFSCQSRLFWSHRSKTIRRVAGAGRKRRNDGDQCPTFPFLNCEQLSLEGSAMLADLLQPVLSRTARCCDRV